MPYVRGIPPVRAVKCKAPPSAMQVESYQGIMQYLGQEHCGYQAMLLSERDDCPRCGAEGYLRQASEREYKGWGPVVFYHGPKKRVGPITCPICKGRTVRRMLEQYGSCAPCRNLKEKNAKQPTKKDRRKKN